MLPYIILLFAPLLFYQVAVIRRKNVAGKTWSVSIGKDPEQLYNSLIVPVFFLLFFLLLALRHETIGRDITNYHNLFNYSSGVEFSTILQERQDILYWILNWVIRRITDDFQIFLAIVSALIVLPIAKIYCEDRQYGFLKIVLFVNMTTFIMIFSGLRQSLAMAFGMVAYEYVRKKKPIKFLLAALIAFGFHHTAFMILFFYPLYYMKLRRNQLWFVVPAIGAVFIFNKQIFGWLTNFLTSVMGEQYEAEVQDTGAYMMIILFVLFAIAAYFFPDEEKMDAEALGLRNFLLMTVLLQCFAPVHYLAMRMNYYFILFVPITIPKMLKYSKDHIKDVAKVARAVMVGFFVVYFLYTVYDGCRTGRSALDTYPYRFFWE